ncbi:MAG: endonuclease III [Planctomycetes bacterium]|nr:endonuclease III [Planctomycetota bacterium]
MSYRKSRKTARRGGRRGKGALNGNRAFIREVLGALRRARGPVGPWRREDPVACLIGTILAQATTDRLADRAYRALRRRFPSWPRVLAAPRAQVERAIRFCGLARQKARAIQSSLHHLQATRGRLSLDDLRRPGLDVDRALADLCRAHGVGIKTAAITLMFGCGADLCAVDTHLARLLRRLRVVPEAASPARAFRLLRPLVSRGRGLELHLQLIRLGREVCKAQRPRCGECPLLRICPHGRRNSAKELRNPFRSA